MADEGESLDEASSPRTTLVVQINSKEQAVISPGDVGILPSPWAVWISRAIKWFLPLSKANRFLRSLVYLPCLLSSPSGYGCTNRLLRVIVRMSCIGGK